MTFNAFITYCSPAGSTRQVAAMIEKALVDKNVEVHSFDIGKDESPDDFIRALTESGDHALLFAGSPVYKDVAIPPVTDFLKKLPRSMGAYAVPFVTWGQACSGIALWQLGRILVEGGFRLAAAAKVLAVHSMMWTSENPAAKGHPDSESQAVLTRTVYDLIDAHRNGGFTPLSLDTLDYQPSDMSKAMKPKIDEPLMVIPRTIRTEDCTQCGICAEICPVSAIALNPFPGFQAHCFGCMSCVKTCPTSAIEMAIPLAQIETMIRQRILTIKESPGTQVFLPGARP